jgi:signal transduction histidine kinase
MMRRTDSQPVDLMEALAVIGTEASIGKSATFDINVVGDAKALTIEAKDQLLDIAREAVRNAYRHAESNHIVVTIEYGSRSLILRIEDDGRGIDPAVIEGSAKSGHFGLTGMRERAKHLGGRFSVRSRLGSGTRIEAVLPAAIAYRDVLRWPWNHPSSSLREGRFADRESKSPESRGPVQV